MTTDTLPGEMLIPTRAEQKARTLRDIAFRGPDGLDTTQGTQPDIDADLVADVAVPMHANVRRAGWNLVLATCEGAALEEHGRIAGLAAPYRRPAVGASGAVTVVAATLGGTILAGTELREPNTGNRYQATTTGLYLDGDPCPVVGVDTGTGTNLDVDAVLEWTSPPPGIGPKATVADDGEGNGLTGGRGAETDAELRERIISRRANPPASGNDSAVQDAAESCPYVSVEKAFTYPAANGPGTYNLAFTKRRSETGGDRIPSATEIALVDGWVRQQFPYDDSLTTIQIAPEDVDVVLGVDWRSDVPGWIDAAPFPNYLSGTSAIRVTAVTSATSFTLGNVSASYGSAGTLATGKTIALWNESTQSFSRKKSLSVTGTGPWVVTVDTTLGISDTSYLPVVGQRACPWSDSMDTVAAPVLEYFDGLGPGQIFASFFDEGRRQRRSPASPLTWPDRVGNRLIGAVLDVATVADAELTEPTVPLVTSVGTMNVFAYLMQLDDLSVFPQT